MAFFSPMIKDINIQNESLFKAILSNQMDSLTLLLSQKLYDPANDMLLIRAIQAQTNESMICKIVEAGWNPNARDPQFMHTAIMLAAKNGYPRLINKLIEFGGDINATDSNDSNAATSACQEKSARNIECLKLLIAQGINVNQGRYHSPLMWAISDGAVEMVSILLDAVADPNYFYERGNALYAAIENNRPNAISILLKYGADPLAVIPSPWFANEFAGLTIVEFAKRCKRTKLVAILEGQTPPASTTNVALLPAIWKEIEKQIRQHDADPSEILRPGASAVQLQQLQTELNSKLPSSIVKSWMIHDGQPEEIACFRLAENETDNLLAGEADLYRLLPCDEIPLESKRAAESYAAENSDAYRFTAEDGIAPVAWSSTWLPLARNLSGDLICCDLAAPLSTRNGQIVLVSSENPVRSRIANDWCKCLEKLRIGLGSDY